MYLVYLASVYLVACYLFGTYLMIRLIKAQRLKSKISQGIKMSVLPQAQSAKSSIGLARSGGDQHQIV